MYTAEQLCAAAKIVALHGVYGAQQAGRIVGVDVARGMVILFLTEVAGREVRSDGWVDEVLATHGLLETFEFSPRVGRAVVYDQNDKPVWFYDLDEKEVVATENVPPINWMHYPREDNRTIFAGPSPYTAAREELRQEHQKFWDGERKKRG